MTAWTLPVITPRDHVAADDAEHDDGGEGVREQPRHSLRSRRRWPVGVNAFPWANPPLPSPIDVGESASWVYDISMLVTMIRFFRQRGSAVDSILGVIALGSGENVELAPIPVDLLGPI